MPTYSVGKAEVDDMTPTVVANTALGALVGNLALAAVADRRWEPLAAKFGEVIQIPVRGSVSVNAKSADTDVTLQIPATTNAQITLNNHYEASLIFEDIATAFANQDVVAGYASDAAVVMAEKIETTGFVEAYTSFTTNADIGTAAVDITDALVVQARRVLKVAKVPAGAPIYMFVSAKDMEALLQLSKYTDAHKTGDGGALAKTGAMTFEKYGMTFVESQYVQKVSTTTHCLAFSPEGLALAMRPLPTPKVGVMSAVVGGVEGSPAQGLGIRTTLAYRPEKIAHQLTVDALWGWKVVRGAFGQDILT